MMMMMVVGRKEDTAKYPAVTKELAAHFSAVASIEERRILETRLEGVSEDAVQQLLSYLYRCYGANPAYLFVAEGDYPELGVSQLYNEASGRTVCVVLLPGLRAGSVLVGMF